MNTVVNLPGQQQAKSQQCGMTTRIIVPGQQTENQEMIYRQTDRQTGNGKFCERE